MPARGLPDQVAGFINRQRPSVPDQCFEVGTVYELECQIRAVVPFVRVVSGDEVRVVQSRGRPHLPQQALAALGCLEQLGRQNFERHGTVHRSVPRLVHAAHLPATHLLLNHVRPQVEALRAARQQTFGLKPGQESPRHECQCGLRRRCSVHRYARLGTTKLGGWNHTRSPDGGQEVLPGRGRQCG